MKKTIFFNKFSDTLKMFVVLMISISIVFATSCKKDDDDDDETPTTTLPTIPSDDVAGVPPAIDNNSLSNTIPNPAFSIASGTSNRIVMQMTGIKDPTTGQFINIAGTGDANQTCWVQVNGVNKGILVTKGTARTKALVADVVFLVDNSGSMGEEADSIAVQITNWVNYLSTQGLDLKVGVVGYDSYVTGALNITDANTLNNYLNNRTYYGYPIYGTSRTVGFYGADSATMETNASAFGYAGGENGVLAANFATDYFGWRGGSRVFVNFTDEPNQPGYYDSAFSVYDIANNWNPSQGTIHTVFSEDTTYYSYSWQDYVNERPWMMSIYTGGTYIFVDSYASDLNLNDLPVTGALAESFTIEYINNETAPYNVTIFIQNSNGNDGTREYKNITY